MTFVLLSDWPSDLTPYFTSTYCHTFVPLTKENKDRSSPCGTNISTFISGLKFISMNINSIRGKKLELLAFLDRELS